MSILIIFENKDSGPWEKILKEKLPNTLIEVYPKVKDSSTVNFVICWKPKNNVLSKFPNVKVIQSVGASIDHITNSQKISNSTIISRIVDKQLSIDMWEFLVAVVLSEIKNLPDYANQQKLKIWKQHQYQSIKNTTIAILGLGKIGGLVAENFANLGFKVKGWSSSKKEISNVHSFSGEHEFDDFLENSNFLINLLPLTKQTEGILNEKILQKLTTGTFLINVGRGEHLIDKDLIKLLDSSHLSGALLDVFHEEPLPKNHPFWTHPKIKITPHIASLTNVESVINQVIENYQRFINNQELLHTVSIQKGY
jgi:glyoxylate/hydroxypyruvate reductase A